MAYDADGNFYNPYQPGTFEYDYEESQRGQFAPDLTPEEQLSKAQKDAADIAAREAWYATPEYQALVAAGANEPGYGNTGLDFFSSVGKFFSRVAPYVLAVAPMVIPGLGQMVGAAILESVGLTGAAATSAASAVGLTVKELGAAVGATAISSANTVLQGGSVEDVLKSAAGAGVASGLNFGMGGGVPGAVTGSVAGTVIKGGDASQVLTNAFAAGVGAGVQGAMTENPDAGKIIGSAARTYIATGGDMDQTLLNTAATAIGTLDNPAKTVQQAQAAVTPASDAAAQEAAAREIEAVTQSDAARRQELANYQEVLNQYAIDKAIYEQTYGPIETAAPPAAAPSVAPAAEATLPSQTVVAPAPVVSPVVTDLDLVKQVAAQPTPTVDPKELEQVIVQGQGANVTNVAPVSTEITTPRPDTTAGLPTPAVDQQTLQQVLVQGQGANVANVAPVETTVPSTTVPSTATVATPTPAQPFPTPIVTPVAEPKKEAPVVTDIPPVEPPQTEFERRFINETVAAPVTTGPELQQVTVRETVPRPAEPVEFEQKTIQETVPRVSDVVAETPAPPPVAPPSAAPPTELEQVTVRETVPKVSDVVTDVPVPPTEPPPPPAPEVKAEEPKKEEPKKEAKKLYPTVTSVPPPKRPGRQPIITGASPARLLADALAAYRPAGAIEGEESGKERRNVWNEKSLRLKDALGL